MSTVWSSDSSDRRTGSPLVSRTHKSRKSSEGFTCAELSGERLRPDFQDDNRDASEILWWEKNLWTVGMQEAVIPLNISIALYIDELCRKVRMEETNEKNLTPRVKECFPSKRGRCLHWNRVPTECEHESWQWRPLPRWNWIELISFVHYLSPCCLQASGHEYDEHANFPRGGHLQRPHGRYRKYQKAPIDQDPKNASKNGHCFEIEKLFRHGGFQ